MQVFQSFEVVVAVKLQRTSVLKGKMSFLFSLGGSETKTFTLAPEALKEVPPPALGIGIEAGEQDEKVVEKNDEKALVPQQKKIQSVVSRKLMPLAMIVAKGQRKGTKGRSTGEIVRLFSNEFPFFPIHVKNENIYKISQFVALSTFVSNSAVAVFYAQAFVASAIDQISSLTAVFDQYRIAEVEIWFWPRITPGTGVTVDAGMMATAVDYDDANALTTFPQALDYQNVLVSDGRQGHYHRFVPHVALAAYSGAFTSFANKPAPWIDAASTGVQHYGIKAAWTATDVSLYTYSVQARLHMEFRNVR